MSSIQASGGARIDDRTRRRYRSRSIAVLAVLALLSTVVVGVASPAAAQQAPCQVGQLCEAELATRTGTAGIATNHPGFTGSGFVDGIGSSGAGIVFQADVPTAGEYVVRVRYANGDGAIGIDTRSMTLGTPEGDVRVQFPLVGQWSEWGAVAVRVNLPAGVSDLDLHVGPNDDGNVNIDHLVVDEVPAGSAEGTEEQGVTLRVFDVGIGLQEICELRTGQTPNTDVLRPTVNYFTTADWGGHTVNYVAQVVADLTVADPGTYTFRLVSDDGSRLSIDGEELIDHDGLHAPSPMDGTIDLAAGRHQIEIDYFQAGGGASLALFWKRPGENTFEVVPNEVLSTEGGGARVVAPGIKECVGLADSPGDNAPLASVHPSFELSDLRPDDGFQPDVSGMSWFADGSLAVLTWGASQSSSNGKLYRVENVQGEVDLDQVDYLEIASGLREPQGVQIVDDEIYVATKTDLEKLVDADGDGFYEGRENVATWPNGNNFHEFAFGLPYRDGFFYVALSVALERSGDSTVPQPAPDRGTVLKIDKDTGEIEYIAGGLRTPNGIAWGPNDKLLVTDNQGGWLPSSKLVEIEEGAFYNHYTWHDDPETGERVAGRFDDQPVTPPVVWMPQNEIANSPSTPVVMEEGLFAGQLAIGDVTYGGLQRVSMEEVEGQMQGALYRMTQGLEAGINQVDIGPDGDIYLGGIGYDGNWNQPGKLRYGLQKLTANDTVTMDILTTEITETGFDLTYTKPLSEETLAGIASAYEISQWRYNPTSGYGGPKIGQEQLFVEDVTVSEDGRTVSLDIPGVRPDRVVHLRSPRPFTAADGESLWSTEVWYTANAVPGFVPPEDLGFYEAEEATILAGAGIANEHNGYSGSGFVDGFNNLGATLTFGVDVEEAGTHPVHVRYANGPHPFDGTKTVNLYVNGEQLDPVEFPRTGDWQTWRMLPLELELEAGANTITFRYEDGVTGSVNFDLLTVGDRQDICSPVEVEPGYTSLFDGTLESFSAWRMAGAGSFGRQADCTLRTEGGLGLLWYAPQEFGSYSLKLDWKLVKDDNSGVFVGFPNPGNDPWIAVDQGYEIQIDETDAADRTTGAIYTFQGADPDAVAAALNPWGQWNEYEIQVEGQTIKVILNGVLVNDFVSTDPARDLENGFVGIQNHGPGETVFFRNIRIDDGSVDTTAPIVEGSLAGETDDEGRYLGPVTITLDATDDEGGSGVASIEYALDGGDWVTYDEPVTVEDPGDHEVVFRATDEAGNVSEEGSLGFTIVAPEPDACPDGDDRPTVVIGGIDSGVTNADTGDGCTIADLLHQGASWPNHGQFQRHVTTVVRELVATGIIDQQERGRIVSAAARSNVGKR